MQTAAKTLFFCVPRVHHPQLEQYQQQLLHVALQDAPYHISIPSTILFIFTYVLYSASVIVRTIAMPKNYSCIPY